jgi:hypothetical protein
VEVTPAARLPLLAAAFASLVFGVAAGLARLGWDIRLPHDGLAALHGPLMASAFFGTVISLERAVAVGSTWAYLGPLAAGAGGLAMVFGAQAPATVLLAAGSLVFVFASGVVMRRQPLLHNACLALGAAGWLAGNLLLATGEPAFAVTPWWMGFLVLTIAGERLELSRFMPPSTAARRVFIAIMACLAFAPALGWPVMGGALLALAVWLAWKDVALRTIRAEGLTRYIAACLLAGYAWLAVASAIMLSGADMQTGRLPGDAALHAVFLGFVFSMVFGHAPIIAPALFRIRLPYHPGFYLPLALLHASVALRVVADLVPLPEWRATAGAGHAAAIAVFVATMLAAVLRGRRAARPSR